MDVSDGLERELHALDIRVDALGKHDPVLSFDVREEVGNVGALGAGELGQVRVVACPGQELGNVVLWKGGVRNGTGACMEQGLAWNRGL